MTKHGNPDRRINRLIALLTFAGIFAMYAATSAFSEPSVYPVGVTVYDPSQAYNCYVLFAGPDGDGKTRLIDMDGHVVHTWSHMGFPSGLLNPAVTGGKRGHIIVQLSSIQGASIQGLQTSVVPGRPALSVNQSIGELDWHGRVTWEWGSQAPGGAAQQHHDWARLPNGHTLVLSTVNHAIAGFSNPHMLDDVIYDVDPAGKVVWKWLASAHLSELGFTAADLAYMRKTSNPDFLHLNDMQPLGPNHWFSAGDDRFAPDNIIISSRNANFIVIIDKKTGHVVWRVGPDYAIKSVSGQTARESLPAPIEQISGEHDAHMIPEGLPGAGDILVFDNHGSAGYPPVELDTTMGSRVLEINPVTKRIVWSYSADDAGQPSWDFYSPFIGSAYRLPNGNTLIDEGYTGRIFQVNRAKKIVWEYMNPYFVPTAVGAKIGGPPVLGNWVYRAQPVPYSWVPSGTPHGESAVAPAWPIRILGGEK